MRNVTNSYKHLFFRAILKGVELQPDGFLSYEKLFAWMLEEAWWPAFHYRLSLGKTDKVVALLEQSIKNADELRLRPDEVPKLVAEIPFDLKAQKATGILRYVPQRLILPWFEDKVKGTNREDALVRRFSIEEFATKKPLYKVLDDGIQIHPDWQHFILEWHDVFRGWSDANWLAFLESRNPHALGLFAKIKPAFQRSTLVIQRRIWAEASTRKPFHCIYTGTKIVPAFFAVDHFLPHAFVGHDRFWNLTPVDPGLNLAKRDSVPAEEFIGRLAEQHAQLHKIAPLLSKGAQSDLRRTSDEYAVDLGADETKLSDSAYMKSSYWESFPILYGIAGRMGFPLDWCPNS
ncbi:MAG: hypothetical protein COC12_04105 [Rhodobacteraceae bacterium]|nr:MAG: hypothetical protein COC12_04105 [Paracoccaceae bacterium]